MSKDKERCPCCGGETLNILNIKSGDNNSIYMYAKQCAGCGLRTRYYDADHEAVNAWVRRPAAHRYELAELRFKDEQFVYCIDKNDKIRRGEWGLVNLKEGVIINSRGAERYLSQYDKRYAVYDKAPGDIEYNKQK